MLEINKIHNYNCLDGLKLIGDDSIDCCVTSPPYWGLRDYKVDEQIGLEKTPELYVQKLVEVFREVKRMLKKEGTLFLNLGDSYSGSKQGRNGDGSLGVINSKKQRSNAGSLNDRHEVSCGTSGKEPEGYLMNGCFSQNLCDGCQRDYHNRKFHNDSLHVPMQSVLLFSQIQEYMEGLHDHLATSDFLHLQQIMQFYFSNQDLKHFAVLEVSQIAVFLQTNFAEFYQQFQDLYWQISNNDLIQLPFETSIHYVQEFAYKLHHELLKMPYYTQSNVSLSEELAQNSQCTYGYCSQCGSYSHTLKTYIQPQSYKEFSNLPKILKPKDLIGIPWMVAFALCADGWYLRQDIIWHKPNPMPESVTDRCTKSHEYIFLLSKSAKYYYDQDAIKEPIKESSIKRLSQNIENQSGSDRVPGKTNGPMKAVVKGYNHRGTGDKKLTGHSGNYDSNGNLIGNGFANKRSVWTVPTMPFKEAHFATFPENLIVPCIKAGCPEGGIVLDPFMGAGTTGVVARKLIRNFIGFELNEEYIKIAEKRLYEELGMYL